MLTGLDWVQWFLNLTARSTPDFPFGPSGSSDEGGAWFVWVLIGIAVLALVTIVVIGPHY